MKRNKLKGIVNISLYALIYLLFVWIVFQNLKTNYVGADESFTFAMIHHSFLSIIHLTADDVHPFLYYFLARICVLPFKNVFTQIKILKLVSALPYLIMLIISNTTIKHKFSTKTSLIFMFMLITAPILNSNILISRMYGWTMLFTTIIFLLLIYVYKGVLKNSLSIFIGISLLTLADFYTQYDAIISVTFIMGFFLVLFIHSKINIRNFITSLIISTILYLPWVKIMLHQTKYVSGSNYYALRFVYTVGFIYRYTKNLVLDLFISNTMPSKISQLFIFMFLILITIGLYLSYIKNKNIMILGITLPFILMIFGLLICMKSNHQILYPRYLISTLGIFWLCVSNIISSIINKNKINLLLKLALLVFIIIIGLKSYQASYNQVKPYINSFPKSESILKLIPKNSHVIFNDPVVMQQMPVYKPSSKNYVVGSQCKYYNSIVNIWSDKGKKAIEGDAYKKVFTKTYLKENLKLPKYKHSYFIRCIGNKENISSLGKPFFTKNKNKLIKLKSTTAPKSIFGKVVLYKIR